MASYTYAVDSGEYVHLAGHGAFELVNGEQVQRSRREVGQDLTPDEAYDVARFVVTGCLSTLRKHLGTLNRAGKIVRVTGYVNTVPDCEDDYRATDGASDLLRELSGQAGYHSRMPIGVAVTPHQTPVAIDMIAEVER